MSGDLAGAERALRTLLATGHVDDVQNGLQDVLSNSAHRVPGGWVVSLRLLQARAQLGTDAELVAALLAQRAELRAQWLGIAAARCQEAGQLPDDWSLIDMVSRLGPATAWVEAAWPLARLAPTAHAALERNLLGAGAEQASVVPALVRVLATAHTLATETGPPLPAMKPVDRSGALPGQNWQPGRLLALPEGAANSLYVLRGAGEVKPLVQGLAPGTLDANEPRPSALQPMVLLRGNPSPQGAAAQPDPAAASLHWLMLNPWAFLLGMVVYAQYAWAAECRGGLVLELPKGQMPHAPSHIEVVVQGVDGSEVCCGSLSDLVLRCLAHLGMGCFPRQPSAESLNVWLAPLLGQLLHRKVWRYVEAASGARGQFQIHPDFADEAFRTTGSRVIRRGAAHVWQAVRPQAEDMKAQTLAQAGAGVQSRHGEI